MEAIVRTLRNIGKLHPAFRRLLDAPIDEPELIPPPQAGVYVVTRQ